MSATATETATAAETGLIGGMVTFRIGSREYATRLDDVREVVRLQGLADLPGMTPPLAGVLDLRGAALPVLDLRGARRDLADGGDVLVLAGSLTQVSGGALVGVAVDEVRAVLPAGELTPAGTGDAGVLPSYVVQVLRGPDGVVFLVDLEQMVQAARTVPQT
jgi:purine-binding chemotaxis protein CheW